MENQETLTDVCEELRSGEYAPLADRIEAARKREGVCRRSIKIPVEVVPTYSTAAMREALLNIAAYAQSAECHTEDSHVLGYLNQVRAWVKAALAEPPRQCDVGTAEEQADRFESFCGQFTCPECTLTGKSGRMYLCYAQWAQRPYDKEGGAECIR